MNVPNLPEALTAVKDTSVTDIIASLALGIADAQEKLDQNSIAQLETLANTEGIDGKSLLELGFLPTFYHFQYADISASIHLKIAAAEEFGLDVSIDVHYSNQEGYSQEKYDFLQETHEEEHVKEFESYNQFAMSAFETDSIKVNENFYNLNHVEGLFSEMEQMSDAMRQTEEISRVDREVKTEEAYQLDTSSIENNVIYHKDIDGFMTVVILDPVELEWGVLEVGQLSTSTGVNLDGAGANEFTTSGDFGDTVVAGAAANGGSVIGLYQNTVWIDDSSSQNLVVYFAFDEHHFDLTAPLNSGVDLAHMKALARILRLTPSLNVKVTGYTDGSGPNDYNTKLSKKRARAVRNWLKCHGVNESQITIVAKGEEGAPDNVQHQDYRRVTIELTGDKGYILFEGGLFDGSNATPVSGDNRFISKNNASAFVAADAIDFGTSGITLTTQSSDSSEDFYDEFNLDYAGTDYYADFRNEVVYIYHKKSTLKFVLMSETEQSIEIESAQGSNSSGSGSQYSYLYDQSSDASNQISSSNNTQSGTSTFAIGGSVDLHYARKFSFSVEGDTSVSARLVSIPAPQVFLDYIASLYP